LLKKWRLPEDVSAAVEYHHSPLAAGPHKQLAAAVAVADAVCYRVGIASKLPHDGSEAEERIAASILGLSEIACADLEVELEDRVAELDSILGGSS
jgi:HD-like signal output (HDOD) protein